jgi:predicted N-acyltransferase
MKSPSKPGGVEVRVHARFADVEPLYDELEPHSEWPFLRKQWLSALEDTGCVSEERGWIPHHLTLHEDGALLGYAPAYVKLNSEGEFVFDHSWAAAAHRARIPYYPKLVVAVPFTPANGPKLLVARGASRERALSVLAAALEAVCERQSWSGAHALFVPKDDAAVLERAGFTARTGVQFHFTNPGYASFEDFLRTLPSKRRTQLRRERRAPDEQGLRIDTLTGSELRPELADHAYRFYRSTVDKFLWGRRYLERAFFEQVFSTMPDGIELVLARDASHRPVAGAFNLRGPTTLYGRYWGADVELPFLHFNVCFYRGIERCIAERIGRFEPGAGGEHKLARGFDPTATFSAHRLLEPRLDAAVRAFCIEERRLLEAELDPARAAPDADQGH